MSVQQTKLKAIADAIREKDGTTAPIPANDFPDRIRAIPSGGVPEGVYTITLETSDPKKGVVSGSGIVQDGVSVAAVATPNDGFKSIGWQENGEIVSEDSEFIFTAKNDRKLTALFGSSIPLPDGYQLLQYVTTDLYFGSPRIATVLLNNLKIELDIAPTAFYSSYLNVLSGKVGTYSNNILQRYSSYYWRTSLADTTTPITDKTVSANTLQHVVLDLVNRTLSVDESKYTVNLPISSGYSVNVYLGGTTGQTGSYTNDAAPMRIYSAKVFNLDDLVAHIVPCLDSDGIPRLYDIVKEEKLIIDARITLTPGPAV